MASTYAELKDQLQLLIDRTDATDLAPASGNADLDWLDVALNNAETRFYRSEAGRIPPFEKVVEYTVAPGTQTLAIPVDYYEGRYAISTVGSIETTLYKTSPEEILSGATSSRVGHPGRIAYGSNNWLIDRPASQTNIKVYYYGYLDDISTVTNASTSHWLLNNAGDALLYLAAYECAMFYGSIDPEMANRWLARGEEIIDNIANQEARQKASLSTPRKGRFYNTTGLSDDIY